MFKSISKWAHERKLKTYQAFVPQVGNYEIIGRLNSGDAKVDAAATEAALRERFASIKDRVDVGNDMAEIMPQAFAAVRDAAKHVLGIRAYDVQIMGALALCNGAIAEMATGEGKTLTAVFAAYIQHLQGKQVHIYTANEYLAQRDANAMLKLYVLMGMTVGVLRMAQPPQEKWRVYTCDVVYGTSTAFAMDYLADHLAGKPTDVLQGRGLGFALVDEADSLLIDEARVPVVLTAVRPADASLYNTLADMARTLQRAPESTSPGHFYVDGKDRQVVLTDAGYEAANAMFIAANLLPADEATHYGFEHQHLLQKLTVTLSAMHLLFRDQHYVVQDGVIVIVDELTGRLMPNRSWDGGLQQALEAKEGLKLSPESQVLGRILLQHFFKLYEKLAGMTGTASTEAEELRAVYGLEVIEIPTNKPCIRVDEPDRFYRTQAAKMAAVVADIEVRHAKGQPVLIGTASIEQSEQLSAILSEKGLCHNVLNAREHAREADIIAEAGAPAAITVSTNMSGRGVDIILGGNPDAELRRRWLAMGSDAWDALSAAEQKAIVADIRASQSAAAEAVRKAGGLHIIGMERYESRRMDRQLRGRAGRQGDPGSSCFYISFEDPLVENFAGEQIRTILARLDVQPGDELEAALVKKSIDSAQRQVEAQSADVRKQLISFDEVVNKQRAVMYAQRDAILQSEDLHGWIVQLREEQAELLIERYAGDHEIPEGWDLKGLSEALRYYGIELAATAELRELESKDLLAKVKALMAEKHERVASQVAPEFLNNAERYVVLAMLDQNWFDHLDHLAELRKGISLRVHAKEDPQQAYKKDAFKAFEALLDDIKVGMVTRALTWQLSQSEPAEQA